MLPNQSEHDPQRTGDDSEDAIAYCGLCCLDCPIHGGRAAELAEELLAELENPTLVRVLDGLPGVIEGFDVLAGHAKCREFLDTLRHVRCTSFCRAGGGTRDCPIRNCCRQRRLDGCWSCDEVDHCETLAWLQPVHGTRHFENLRTIRKQGMAAFLQGTRRW